ncbi:MAG: SulP family inorganic anion transporter [Lachnospiraceae bacterium]|nr:SulP family inorganic anion transporter [Lachnospiraceae bacterium]
MKNVEGRSKIHWGKDIFAGIVVALVSIPISMGYAQIAGLPAVYGLYGSVLPILLYGLLTTSPQFVVGVDAMPAAMVGGLLAVMELEAESEQAMAVVPIVTFLVAGWFIVFRLFKAGRVVAYISTPVMGGFISGVGMTIILMQVPKLYGGAPGTGEIFGLLYHIFGELVVFHPLSFGLGLGTIAIILVSKRYIPKVPMTVVMLVAGAVLQYFCHLDRYGVKLMPQVEVAFPGLHLPDEALLFEYLGDMVIQAAGIAGVIMAQTLLASGNYAAKYQDKLDPNRELLAYAAMNLAGGASGCCPINGSVSRSGIADSLGCRSQVMSVSASLTMVLVLLFGTSLLQYLPVPVLTAIVITALMGILEVKLFKQLWRVSRNEWFVFMTAFLGVLVFGTLYGVIIGVLLSFGEVAVRAVVPPTAFVGRIPGRNNFYSLKRNSAARPIKHTVIYRFSGNLFFANVDRFERDIEQAIKADTRQVVVDARGIGSVDITAAERLVRMKRSLQKRGIRFYLTEHDGSLNDQLWRLGGEELIESGAVRRTITLALHDAGLEKPYDLEQYEAPADSGAMSEEDKEQDRQLSEYEWAFGSEAVSRMEVGAQKKSEGEESSV